MGSAKFFGKSTQPYYNEVKRAIKLAKEEKIDEEFYPEFRTANAEEVLKGCDKQEVLQLQFSVNNRLKTATEN